MIHVLVLTNEELAAHCFPNVQTAGDAYTTQGVAIRAIQMTSDSTHVINGEELKIESNSWLCKLANDTHYFILPDEIFQLLFNT